MDDASYDSIPRRLRSQAQLRPNDPAYFVREPNGAWVPTDWKTYAHQVEEAGRALIALGLEPGERVCILGFNRPEWVIMDVAAMMAGGVPAGIYTTCSPAEVRYVIEHAEARVVLIEDESQWAKINAERARLPSLKHVVTMKGVRIDDPLVLSWEAFMARAVDVPEPVLAERLLNLQKDGVGTFIYTSGTTGPAKAVMLSHENLAWTAECALEMTDIRSTDRMLSYLPLSHIAEQMFTIHIPITVGASVYYARSMTSVPDDLPEVRPTVFLGVPRVWEKMRAKIQVRLEAASPVRARLAAWAMGIGRRFTDLRIRGQKPPIALTLQHALADRLVLSKVRAKLGFDALRIAVTGAAPISKDVLDFFAGLSLPIHEVYGQSEGSGPTTFNRPGDTRLGTVGKPLPGTEVALVGDSPDALEIRVKGPHVFLGYYKDEEATRSTLENGWLLTGDLGDRDEEGFFRIVGRKKEILITSGGKNIAPKNIEAALKDLPLVSQAVAIGDRRPFITALITLDPDASEAFRQEHGLGPGPLHDHPQVRAHLQKGIDERVNPEMQHQAAQVRRFAVLPRDLSVETGELTPSLKVKRRIVEQNFAREIEALYASEEVGRSQPPSVRATAAS